MSAVVPRGPGEVTCLTTMKEGKATSLKISALTVVVSSVPGAVACISVGVAKTSVETDDRENTIAGMMVTSPSTVGSLGTVTVTKKRGLPNP